LLELKELMTSTYKAMGVDIRPSSQDVQKYMNENDTNGDGELSLMEFE